MDPRSYSPLNIVAFGWAMSATLLVVFGLCLIVAIALPGWTASHALVALFSPAPVKSVRVWIDVIIASLILGWITAVVMGLVYNRLIGR